MPLESPSPRTYADIFERRGQAHAQAFALYPQAIRQEAQSLLELAHIQAGEVVLDVPSASGFLSRFLTVPGVTWLAADPSPQMHALCRQVVPNSFCAPMADLPLHDATVDVVLCLAGLHHEPDLPGAFSEAARVLRPGGRLVLAEVDQGSAPAEFLNGFVHRHASTGHVGAFLDLSYLQALEAAHFELTVDRVVHYHWVFPSSAALAHGLSLMFGIDRASPEHILQATHQILGVDELPDGSLGLRWSLRQLCGIARARA